MKNSLFTFGLIFVELFFIKNSYEIIPPDIKLCKAEDTDCISKTVTNLLKNNPNGKSDFSLPALEPLKVSKLDINQNGVVKFQMIFTNLEIYGLSHLNISRAVGFSKDPSKSKFELYGTVPKIQLKGPYETHGRILILPIEGNGNGDIMLESVKTSAKFKPILINKNGKTYIGVDKLKILLEPSNMKVRFDNLFHGDKALGDNMNAFINENWKEVWTDLSSAISNGIGDIFKAIISNIFQLAPYEDIYEN